MFSIRLLSRQSATSASIDQCWNMAGTKLLICLQSTLAAHQIVACPLPVRPQRHRDRLLQSHGRKVIAQGLERARVAMPRIETHDAFLDVGAEAAIVVEGLPQ